VLLTLFIYGDALQCTQEFIYKKLATEVDLTKSIIPCQPRTGKLEFSHITKTGGTTIEEVARSNVLWGNANRNKYPQFGCGTTSAWHVPRQFCERDPYAGSDVFIVIRNTSTRVISEYNCPWRGFRGEDAGNPEVLNTWIKINMRFRLGGDGWMKQHFHMAPQSLYAIDPEGKVNVDAILRFETLGRDFNMLMEVYGLDIKLNLSTTHKQLPLYARTGNTDRKSLTVQDLDQESLALVNEFYSKDIQVFGY